MTAAQFTRAGMQLFPKDDQWVRKLGLAIGRTPSMVRRYANDDLRIPYVVEVSVTCLLAMSPQQKGHLRRRIKSQVRPPGRPWNKRKLKPRETT